MQNVKIFIIPNSFNIGGDVPTAQTPIGNDTPAEQDPIEGDGQTAQNPIGTDAPTEQNAQPTHHKYIGFAFDYAHPTVSEAKVIDLIEEHLIEGKITHTQYAEIVDKLNALDDDAEIPFVYATHSDIVELAVQINSWVETYTQS